MLALFGLAVRSVRSGLPVIRRLSRDDPEPVVLTEIAKPLKRRVPALVAQLERLRREAASGSLTPGTDLRVSFFLRHDDLQALQAAAHKHKGCSGAVEGCSGHSEVLRAYFDHVIWLALLKDENLQAEYGEHTATGELIPYARVGFTTNT